MSVWQLVFTVRGSGRFPLDMLRYDKCWPHGSIDAAAIDSDGERSITLVTVTAIKPPRHDRNGLLTSMPAAIREERWRSFGWRVCSPETIGSVELQ